MDPLSFRFMSAAGASDQPVLLTTIAWTSNTIDTATISGANLTATEAATFNNNRALTGLLPSITSGGWYLDWIQVEGYVNYVNFVGLARNTVANYLSSGATTWYWSGSIWQDGTSSTSTIGTLSTGTHRLAAKLISGLPYVYFRNGNTNTVVGPYLYADATNVTFVVFNQTSYKVGDVTIANGGAVYSGGGGLF